MSVLALAWAAWMGAVPGAAGEPVRVENRLFVKSGRIFAGVSAAYLVRGDYYESPGLTLSAAYYPDETDGLELDVGGFASFMDGGASDVFDHTGLQPDAHAPRALALIGWRHSLGFGKVLLGESALWHLDVQSVVRAGAIFADGSLDPSVLGGAEILARISPTWFGVAGLSVVLSYEQRQGSGLVFGLLPTIGMGGMW